MMAQTAMEGTSQEDWSRSLRTLLLVPLRGGEVLVHYLGRCQIKHARKE